MTDMLECRAKKWNPVFRKTGATIKDSRLSGVSYLTPDSLEAPTHTTVKRLLGYLCATVILTITPCVAADRDEDTREPTKTEWLSHEQGMAVLSGLLSKTPPEERNIYSPESSYRYTARSSGVIVEEDIQLAGEPFRSSSDYCRFYSLKINRPSKRCEGLPCGKRVGDSYQFQSRAWIRREQNLDCTLDDLSAPGHSSPLYTMLAEDVPDKVAGRLFSSVDVILSDMRLPIDQRMVQPYDDSAPRIEQAVSELLDKACRLLDSERGTPSALRTPLYVGGKRWVIGATFVFPNCSKGNIEELVIRALVDDRWKIIAYDLLVDAADWPPAPWAEDIGELQ